MSDNHQCRINRAARYTVTLKRTTFRFTIVFVLFLGLTATRITRGQAATPAALPPQAKPVERILVPVPKEIFDLLDEFHDANWHAVERPEITRWKSRGDQVQIALLLGSVVAEGFIAMEAEDATQVRNIGNRVLSLARGLGVEKVALRRSKSIMDKADANQWAAARQEWDGVLSDLERGMVALKSEPLSQLVSSSGWLRGTDALCVLVLQDYSPERAELIRQPGIVDFLYQQVLSMPPQMRKHRMVDQLEKGLQKIRPLLDPEAGPLTQDKVTEIGKICDELVKISSQRP